MKNKVLAGVLVSMAAGVILAGTAFAQSSENLQETETKVTYEMETEESNDPLTPDGNLTLVDDVTAKTDSSKQFLTFVSKSGNYFYMVIDHDKEGEDNVHFLNLVDEEDLLALMDEDAVSAYEEVEEQETEEAVVETTAESEITPLEESENTVNEKGTVDMRKRLPAIAALIALIGGAAAFAFSKMKEKKKLKENKKDPDLGYIEDDENETEDLLDYEEDDADE